MFERFKTAIAATAEHKSEIRLVTVASLLGGGAIVYSTYVVGCLSGLIGW